MGSDDADLLHREWGRGTSLPSGLDLGVVRMPWNLGSLALGIDGDWRALEPSTLDQKLVSSEKALQLHWAATAGEEGMARVVGELRGAQGIRDWRSWT